MGKAKEGGRGESEEEMELKKEQSLLVPACATEQETRSRNVEQIFGVSEFSFL